MTICLAMIVKDEAKVIARCLSSVMPLIDYWRIVDTGSTDDTKTVIEDHMRGGKPGLVVERPWVDFATNRSEALEIARNTGADYTLVIDADDVLCIPAGFVMPDLTADSYSFDFEFGSTRYQRQQLIKNTLPWRYRGVVHEFLECEGAGPQGHLPLTIVVGNDGARRQDPDKYRKDAEVLERALETETDPFMRSRYTFYLAQSWKDAGEKEKALTRYLERVSMGFWQDEVFISWLNVGRLQADLGNSDPALAAFMLASAEAPHRAEAIQAAAHHLRMRQHYEAARQMARSGLFIPQPPNGLFVEPWVYQYGLLDEFAISAYWSGHYRESVDACEILLSEGKCPDRDRLVANANFARRALLRGGMS